MFLSIEFHHDKTPRGWLERFRRGTAPDTKEGISRRQHLLDNERPPHLSYSAKWRDRTGVFWTIERWFIKGLTRFEQAHVLKRDCEAISVTGTIELPHVNMKYVPPRGAFSAFNRGSHVLEGVGMKTYDLVPSWFDEEVLKGNTLICRVGSKGPRIVNVYSHFNYKVVIENDEYHPVVMLS